MLSEGDTQGHSMLYKATHTQDIMGDIGTPPPQLN